MASKATKSRRAQWELAYNRYIDLNLRLQATEDIGQVEALGRDLAGQADELMSMRAPNFTGILQKLYILWGETDLHSLDRSSEEKRLLLEDLEELIEQTSQLVVMRPDQQPVRTVGLWPADLSRIEQRS